MERGNFQSSSRTTKQKTIIIDLLKEKEDVHLTADEIFNDLSLKNTPVPKATIYRTLSSFEKNGVVRKYVLSDKSPACYQFINQNKRCNEHCHFLCNDCGDVVHLNDVKVQNVIEDLNSSNGFLVDMSKTVFYGKCNKCI